MVRSNAAHPPSPFCMASIHFTPRFPAAVAFSPPACRKAIATIVAYSVFSLAFGFDTLFDTPEFVFRSPVELLPYTLLALVVAVAAGLFVKIFYGLHGFFERLALPNYIKPMLGGFSTGLLATVLFLVLDSPAVLDVMAFGYGSLQQALTGSMTIPILLALALGKMLTTGAAVESTI